MIDSSRPLLIVHVVYRFDIGGLENGVVNLINRLPESTWRHAVVALTDISSGICATCAAAGRAVRVTAQAAWSPLEGLSAVGSNASSAAAGGGSHAQPGRAGSRGTGVGNWGAGAYPWRAWTRRHGSERHAPPLSMGASGVPTVCVAVRRAVAGFGAVSANARRGSAETGSFSSTTVWIPSDSTQCRARALLSTVVRFAVLRIGWWVPSGGWIRSRTNARWRARSCSRSG